MRRDLPEQMDKDASCFWKRCSRKSFSMLCMSSQRKRLRSIPPGTLTYHWTEFLRIMSFQGDNRSWIMFTRLLKYFSLLKIDLTTNIIFQYFPTPISTNLLFTVIWTRWHSRGQVSDYLSLPTCYRRLQPRNRTWNIFTITPVRWCWSYQEP